MFRSILPGRALQRADYDLPLYRTYQEPEAFPPAPVAKSIHFSKSASQDRSPSALQPARTDDLTILARRERHYQRKLQELIDAQSDGLMAGIGGGGGGGGGVGVDEIDDGQSDTPTQTTYSLRSGSVSPNPLERKRKKRTLAQARRGIGKTVLDCAAVKEEEDYLLKQELRHDQEVLQQLEVWSSKESGLKEKIHTIENEDRGAKAEELQREATKLELEIQDMETRLAQMKTRHRRVMNEIAGVENAVSSKLSSYKTSLGMLERDVQGFLRAPPVSNERGKEDSPFLSLPPKRRTLQLAREHWQNDVEELRKQRRSVRRDRVALQDGAAVWQGVVAEVTEFETYLKNEIGKLAQQQTSSVSTKGKAAVSSTSSSPADLLDRLDSVAESIEEKLELARTKQWRLLEVCIEAELAALQQGKEVLEEILGVKASSQEKLVEDGESNDSEHEEQEQPSTQGSSIKDLFASAAEGLGNGNMSHSAALRKSMYDEDDEGPDPELLFSRPADDTE